MTSPRPSACTTCRFIGYTRRAGEQPTDLTCANPETRQVRMTPVLSDSASTIFVSTSDLVPFVPPNLAFGCNRWAERAPDVGMVPVHLGGPPAWRSVPYQPTDVRSDPFAPDEPLADVRRGTFVVFDPVTTGPKPC